MAELHTPEGYDPIPFGKRFCPLCGSENVHFISAEIRDGYRSEGYHCMEDKDTITFTLDVGTGVPFEKEGA